MASQEERLPTGGDRLLTLKAVADRTTLSKSAIKRMVREGEFVVPLRLSARRVAWRESEVLKFIESRPRAQS